MKTIKIMIRKWLGIDYLICSEHFYEEINNLKQEIKELKNKYHGIIDVHGIIHGEGQVTGLIELKEMIISLNHKISSIQWDIGQDIKELKNKSEESHG